MLLDDQATQILSNTDIIAERMRKLGGATLKSVGDIARRQRIRDNDEENVSAKDMLAELLSDNLSLVAQLKELKEIVDAAPDNATSGLVDGWTDEAEQRAWFLEQTAKA